MSRNPVHKVGKWYGVLVIYVLITSTHVPIKSYVLVLGLRANAENIEAHWRGLELLRSDVGPTPETSACKLFRVANLRN